MSVSRPNCKPPYHQHYHLPSSRNHISRLLIPLEAIRCQVTSAPAAGSCFSVPRCKFRAGLSKWGIMSTSADCTQTQTSWPLRLICSMVKSERKAKGILILFETCSKCELQGFPFHLERLQRQNNHIGLHTYMYRHVYTHSLTHPLGSGVNSSKAMFDSSFFRQPLSLPSRFTRSEIDPADSQRGQKEISRVTKFPVKHPSVENHSLFHTTFQMNALLYMFVCW